MDELFEAIVIGTNRVYSLLLLRLGKKPLEYPFLHHCFLGGNKLLRHRYFCFCGRVPLIWNPAQNVGAKLIASGSLLLRPLVFLLELTGLMILDNIFQMVRHLPGKVFHNEVLEGSIHFA